MRRLILLLPFVAAMCAAPAAAQRPSIAGCGTVAVPPADRSSIPRLEAGAACFDAAATTARGAADARRVLIADLTPRPTPPSTPAPTGWTACAAEGGTCRVSGRARVGYEAGQHVVLHSNPGFTALLQRDPRMEGVYDRYIAGWRDRVGDELMLFGDIGRISQWGGFGHREYIDQPLSETPKQRAIEAAIGQSSTR